MSNTSLDKEAKAIMLSKLRNRGCWGARYAPLDTLVRWLSRKIKRNGKRVKRAVKQLVNEGYLILHKRGETVSLSPARSREILGLIRNYGNYAHQRNF